MAYDSHRDRVVLFGGVGPLGALNDLWEWDGANWTQATPATSPVPMSFHGLAYDAVRQNVVLFGGVNASQVPLNETWTWNGIAWTKRTPGTNPAARSRSPLAYDDLHAGVVLFGGQTASAGLQDTWQWDGTTWRSLSPPAPIPSAGWGHATCFHAAATHPRVVLFGGRTTTGLRTNESWEWNGAIWTPSSTALPAERYRAAMTFDSVRDQTVLFGGHNGVLFGDTWQWDGVRWRRPATTGPAARQGHALVFDTAGSRAVLFGGSNLATTTFYQDTWVWNGTAWQSLNPPARPPAMWLHAMAYDSLRHRTVLFGGRTASSADAQTWEFDGTTWAQIAPLHRSPPNKEHMAMAFDAARGKVVLVHAEGPQTLTWEWDGVDWTQAAASVTPPALDKPTLTYDSARARCVLTGNATPSTFMQTWEWNGHDWRAKSHSGAVPPRSLHTAAYDSARRRLVLFGGTEGGTALNDTWEYISGSFASFATYGAGCLGSRGVPSLAALPGSLPGIGDILRVEVALLPLVPTATVMHLGLSKTVVSGIPLPLDLGFLGMPGCRLHQSANFSFPILNTAGSAPFVLPLPTDETLLGLPFYLQAMVMDRNANPIGLIWSNGGEAVIGS